MSDTNTEGLRIIHKRGDIVENTLGRLGSISTNLLLLTPGAIFKNIPIERVEELKERYRDVNWKGQVDVYLNHSPLFKQMGRLFQLGKRRTNFFVRTTFGLLGTVGGWIAGKLARADYYNPWTESITTYHPNRAVVMHEIGHAEDFDQSEHPTLRAIFGSLPIINSKIEWNASRNAMEHLNPEERQQASKILEPAWGTYIGGDILKTMMILTLPLTPVFGLAPLAGLVAGHIKSRLFNKRNVFFNGDSVNYGQKNIHEIPALALVPA